MKIHYTTITYEVLEEETVFLGEKRRGDDMGPRYSNRGWYEWTLERIVDYPDKIAVVWKRGEHRVLDFHRLGVASTVDSD